MMAARSRHRIAIKILSVLALVALASCELPGRTAAERPAAGGAKQIFVPLALSSPAPAPMSYWGINAYISKVERRRAGDNLWELAGLARQAGAQWTREELAWSLIEPARGDRRAIYDGSLRQAADRGLGIIGMLLTTPAWARDPSCRPTREAYWCPPADVQSYARFAAWMVERYDGDGVADAPGSPRIAAWEVWNEPNDVGNWSNIGANDDARKRRYGELMIAAYQAIKAADPTATVLIGSMYIFDQGCGNGICDGINFLSGPGGVFRQVPDARRAFDVFATHPFTQPKRPDEPDMPRIITIEGTTIASRGWLDSPPIGRPDAPIWITEMGWCSAPGACFGTTPVSEDQQANYLIRGMVIAQQGGVQHTSWFQLEDAFDDSSRVGGNAALLRNYQRGAYPRKPAYAAYRTLATLLGDALPVGAGPVHTHRYDPAQPYTNSGGTYDYRYRRGAATIDVLWRPNDSVQVSFPVEPGKPIALVDRDGGRTALAPSGGAVRLTLSERPIMIVQGQ